jgi:hypothetical protein
VPRASSPVRAAAVAHHRGEGCSHHVGTLRLLGEEPLEELPRVSARSGLLDPRPATDRVPGLARLSGRGVPPGDHGAPFRRPALARVVRARSGAAVLTTKPSRQSRARTIRATARRTLAVPVGGATGRDHVRTTSNTRS